MALYISLFPQLIAGPIVRYDDIIEELEGRKENITDMAIGIRRFIIGLGKKVLIADYMALLADTIFNGDAGNTVLIAWLGAIAYTLQIYFDFSGYSDMAIGLGGMFGFHIKENFNYPYIATSVTDFWRRWHISLSSWFKDYIYIPLGGNRCGKCRWIFNYLIVWLLTGVWHGANITFVVWGLFYFLVLIIEKSVSPYMKGAFFKGKIGKLLSRLYTLVVVTCAWVIFRVDSLGQGISHIGKMFGVGATALYPGNRMYIPGFSPILFAVAIVAATPACKVVSGFFSERAGMILKNIGCMLILVLAIVGIIGSTYSPFIYFNF